MTSPTRLMPLYGGLLAAAVGIFLLIRWYGETLVAGLPASAAPVVGASPAGDVLPHVLLALGAVILIGRALGRLLRPLRQPPVIGEILAGILLGPSLLGPNLSSRIIPPDAASAVGVVAQLGVILFMFIVGLELDLGLLRRRAPTAIVISHAGIVVPFLLGAATAAIVYPRLATEAVSFTIFALFLGIVMAITAFPVLARILTDQGLERTPLGTLALGIAAARGLMELIVLNIGLELGVISPTLFSMMVLMALVTTMSSAPALWLFLGKPSRAHKPLDAEPVLPAVK
ncbi:MAG: cation:proton antiporter [Gemmatimonadota bacterium]